MPVPTAQPWSELIPLFPLPNCVLFPGVGLPLHVFEARYRRMVQDILLKPEPDRWLALGLLKENYQHLYETPRAPIHPVACVARLVQAHRFSDGRYNILVVGAARANVLGENRRCAYRRVRAAPLTAPPAPADALPESLSGELDSLLRRGMDRGLIDSEMLEKFRFEGMDGEPWIDVLTFHMLGSEDTLLKQRVLEETSLCTRAEILCHWLRVRLEMLDRHEPAEWPPKVSPN